jgi:hypothetical protein
MAQDEIIQGELDPEIAALLGTDINAGPTNGEAQDFAALFGDGDGSQEDTEGADGVNVDHVDLSVLKFPEITKRLEEVPHTAFDDPNYYKTTLSGEGDIAQRVHGLLQKYLNTKDPKDKGVYRQQIITAYWDFLLGVARKAPGAKLPEAKKYLIRFFLLHPALLNPENKKLFARVVVDNALNQPVYYLDEWFKAVGTGQIRPSATDEAKVARSNTAVRMQQFLEKAQAKLDGARSLLRGKNDERLHLEKGLSGQVAHIVEHVPMDSMPEVLMCYTEGQKRVFSEIQETLKDVLKADRDMQIFLRDYKQAEQDVRILREKVEEAGSVEVDVKAVDTEFGSIRQMAKMTIGRQGNHFPILTSEYYRSVPNDLGHRENVISLLSWIETIDTEVYCRSYKNRLNRIVPYVILIPSYGDYGSCWEPFDKYNRATSRGRIAVPMYPKNLQIAVLAAVADFRWQVAKEKASYYWMEEGITGNYYQWFQKMKMKGDLKEAFIDDYITWITKESDGVQKLDKELRGAFWRHIPFAQPVKEKLKTRSFIYQELYQRDLNRAMSDGY